MYVHSSTITRVIHGDEAPLQFNIAGGAVAGGGCFFHFRRDKTPFFFCLIEPSDVGARDAGLRILDFRRTYRVLN